MIASKSEQSVRNPQVRGKPVFFHLTFTVCLDSVSWQFSPCCFSCPLIILISPSPSVPLFHSLFLSNLTYCLTLYHFLTALDLTCQVYFELTALALFLVEPIYFSYQMCTSFQIKHEKFHSEHLILLLVTHKPSPSL